MTHVFPFAGTSLSIYAIDAPRREMGKFRKRTGKSCAPRNGRRTEKRAAQLSHGFRRGALFLGPAGRPGAGETRDYVRRGLTIKDGVGTVTQTSLISLGARLFRLFPTGDDKRFTSADW